MIRQKSFLQPNIVNPFVHREKLTLARKLQIAIMSVTIAPIRLLMFMATGFFSYLVAIPLTMGVDLKSDKPVGKLRYFLFEILRLLGRLMFFFCGFHYVEVRGEHRDSKDVQMLVMAPHSSFFDGISVFIDRGLPSAVSRSENAASRIMGTMLKATQPVLVSRDDPHSRQNTIEKIKERAQSKGAWPQVLIFPEGCCTNGKALITFKSGAFIPGVAVQPVAIEYLNDWDTYRWTMDGPGAFELLWMTLCQWQNHCRITFMPIYHPDEKEREDPKLFANSVRQRMAKQLGVTSTEHTFEDCRLMRHACKLNLPMESGLIEFAKLSRKLDIDVDKAKSLLSKFSEIAKKNPGGEISIEDFSKFLNLPITPMLQEMFDMYDRNGSGFIDFREYIIGLSLLAIPAVTENTVKLAFKVFDQNDDGLISKEEFNKLIKTTQGEDTDSDSIFKEIVPGKDKISYEEFYDFAQRRPEYAYLFLCYKDTLEVTDYLSEDPVIHLQEHTSQ